ncbi:3399_t:CDS:2 [Funneliformis geosporum]|nr:3399_t:CDS:2 [Funneliformis geosporum]
MATKVQKIMVQPINLIFKYLQNKTRVQIWLYEQVDLRIEGQIIGFDEFMNLVLDNGEEPEYPEYENSQSLHKIICNGIPETITCSE